MFKSKYYLPVDAIAKSYQNEEKIETFTYDNDFDVYQDAVILPIRRIRAAKGLINEGGVCDARFNFIAGYSYHDENRPDNTFLMFSSSYIPNEVETLDEEVVFSGTLINHFGHFIQDSMSRMWYAAKYKNIKVALLLNPSFGWKDWTLESSYHLKLLELLGIGLDRIIIVKKPTRYKSVIVPKQSVYWIGGKYNSKLLRIVYDTARQNVVPKEYKKIYLSRSAWKSPLLNEAYFEEFFSNRGFKVIHTQKLPLDEQISYLAGADEVACTYGTLSQLTMFAKQGTRLICLLRDPKGSIGMFMRQQIVDHMRNLDCVYVDTAFNILPSIHQAQFNLVAPTVQWRSFIKNELGIDEEGGLLDYLNNSKIQLGDYFGLYLHALSSQNLFRSVYGLKFNPVNHLKELYSAISPAEASKMLRSFKITDTPLLKGKLFIYKRSDNGIKCAVKLLQDGRIWPIYPDKLWGEALWTYIGGRAYFLNGGYQVVSEFVIDGVPIKRGYVKYKGVIQAKVSDTCSLETFKPGIFRNWIIRHAIKYLVNSKRYKKLKQTPNKFFKDSKSSLIRFLGKYYIRSNSTVIFYWRRQFQEYFNANDIKQKVEILKDGMDDISKQYIDNFINLSKYWFKSTFVGSQRPKHEQLKHKLYHEFKKTFEQPFPDILRINPYYFYDNYGLADLPKKVLSTIDGKVIIDGGGLNGDTALTFHHHFPNSEIHVYEPLEHYVNIINKFLAEDNCNDKIKPVNKGLGDEITRKFMRFGAGANMADITTIDTEYTDDAAKIGLIKLDVEGMETQIIKGAKAVIARDRPVLAIAIYHRPEDFFELKDRIKALNPAYRFMIRKSEPSLPQADLVLIAY